MRVVRYTLAVCGLALLAACSGGGSTSGNNTMLPPGASNTSPSAPRSVAVPKYTIVDLGANVDPQAINSSNVVVGSALTSSGSGSAFSYQNGVMRLYGTLPGDIGSFASDINDSGTIVGRSYGPGNVYGPTSHAVIFGNSIVDLGGLSGKPYNAADAVNNAGEIVGISGALTPASSPCDVVAVTFDGHGGASAIPGIPDYAEPAALNGNGVLVGALCIGSPSRTAGFSDPPYTAITGPADACAATEVSTEDINDSGDIVGVYVQSPACFERGYLLRNGRYTPIPAPVGNTSTGTTVHALNNADWVVGEDALHALLYVNGTSYDLQSLLTGAGCQNWTLQHATDINANDVIVGTGLLGGVEHGFMLIPQ